MKISLHSTLVALLSALVFSLTGCGGSEPNEEAVTMDSPDSPPPATEDVHDHDHEHGAHGLPVIEASDGTQLEWDFDDDASSFVLLPPAELAEKIETVVVTTKVEDTENTYEFTQQESEKGTVWVTTSDELATAVLMGDAVERELVITTADGEITAPVRHFNH